MNRDDLRFFNAVCETRSIKGAARALKVDHSTVSRRLAALEEALNANLFERTPEGLLQTDVGRTIAPIAARIESLVSELEDSARASAGSMQGPVRIAASPILGDCVLIPSLPALRERFPEVAFHIEMGIAQVDMPRREADIAIRTHPQGKAPGKPSVLARKVCGFGYALYGSRDYVARRGRPEQPERSLAGQDLIVLADWSPGASLNARLEERATIVMTASPYFSLLAAARAGIGLAALPCIAADADPDLVPVSGVFETWNTWLVTKPEAHENKRVHAVKDALLELLESKASAIAGEPRPRS